MFRTGKECDHKVKCGSRCGNKQHETTCFISDSLHSSWPMDHENESEILGLFYIFLILCIQKQLWTVGILSFNGLHLGSLLLTLQVSILKLYVLTQIFVTNQFEDPYVGCLRKKVGNIIIDFIFTSLWKKFYFNVENCFDISQFIFINVHMSTSKCFFFFTIKQNYKSGNTKPSFISTIL